MPEHHLNHLKSIALTPQERTTLRTQLLAYALANPHTDAVPVRAWRWVSRHAAVALGLVVVLVASVTGVSAERSRPGDLLYGFRLTVNDQIESALAFSDDAQIDTEMRQLQRMIDEEDSVRDEALSDLAFAVDDDPDADELTHQLEDVDRELQDLTDEDRVENDSDDDHASDAPESFDDGSFEQELRGIERELKAEEDARLELE